MSFCLRLKFRYFSFIKNKCLKFQSQYTYICTLGSSALLQVNIDFVIYTYIPDYAIV